MRRVLMVVLGLALAGSIYWQFTRLSKDQQQRAIHAGDAMSDPVAR